MRSNAGKIEIFPAIPCAQTRFTKMDIIKYGKIKALA
jgi:hypothetical protein